MVDNPRIAELRRRVEADPASIAFAQLAEEYRRAGSYDEAVQMCRRGLARFPGYVSARVTLGRALIELGKLEEARRELQIVLENAPDNLAATRGIAAIEQQLAKQPAAAPASAARSTAAPAPAAKKPAASAATTRPQAPGPRPQSSGSSVQPTKDDAPIGQAPGPKAQAAGPNMPPTAPGPENATVKAQASAANEPSTKPFDFDAMLKSLRAEDLSTPPVVDALLKEEKLKAAAPEVVLPPLPADAPKEDSFADLEKSLREFDQSSRHAPPELGEMEQMVVAELESWLSAIDNDRRPLEQASQAAPEPPRSSDGIPRHSA